MLVIRFARRGRKKKAFFDLVAAEKSKAVKKKIVEKLGYYDPLANNGEGILVFDAEKVKACISNGAQPSQTVARLLSKNDVPEAGKFIKARAEKPRKPKEEPKKKEEKAEEPATAEAGESAEPTESAEKPEEKTEEVKEETPEPETTTEEPKKEESVKEETQPEPEEAKAEEKTEEKKD